MQTKLEKFIYSNNEIDQENFFNNFNNLMLSVHRNLRKKRTYL